MSAPQPPSLPPDPPSQSAYDSAKHALSLTLLVACPILILLPPRKLDLYTFSLSGAWVASANQLALERQRARGAGESEARGLLGYVDGRRGFWSDLPGEKARETREGLRRQKEKAELEEGKDRDEPRGLMGVGKKLWMGDEKEGWRERRMQEEREALEEGKGYGSLIMDQIWEVWNQGKKDLEEDEESAEDKARRSEDD
ncbi:hypothetical protein MMC20_003193 [Loxospora ochrophaea]|nr:hypothetical protein [Loxospora ochrophaea]